MDPSQATNTEAVLVASAGENRPAAARLSMVAAAGRFSPATGPMETCRPRLANKPLAGSEPSRTKNRCATIGYGKIALDDKRPITEEPRLKVGDPPVSPRRDAVPDDARALTSCRIDLSRSSTQVRSALGNRIGPGMKLAAAAPTTDGSESLATDISGDHGSFSSNQY